jgi:hypothetical protein
VLVQVLVQVLVLVLVGAGFPVLMLSPGSLSTT